MIPLLAALLVAALTLIYVEACLLLRARNADRTEQAKENMRLRRQVRDLEALRRLPTPPPIPTPAPLLARAGMPDLHQCRTTPVAVPPRAPARDTVPDTPQSETERGLLVPFSAETVADQPLG